ncbi:MAG: hypothetical protein JW781_03035 [Deltaproteobacteria bacterium]|nr:hypothetical protein [Candidatus Anaeroferrophillacea bacterium]
MFDLMLIVRYDAKMFQKIEKWYFYVSVPLLFRPAAASSGWRVADMIPK